MLSCKLGLRMLLNMLRRLQNYERFYPALPELFCDLDVILLMKLINLGNEVGSIQALASVDDRSNVAWRLGDLTDIIKELSQSLLPRHEYLFSTCRKSTLCLG